MTMPVDTHDDIMPATGVVNPNGVETHEDIKPAMGMTAYHGSPHEFDQFDIGKIGTGEGAQAYGHGLYFAENENVAKDYRDRLTDRASSFRVENIDMPKWILRKIESHPDRAQAISEIRNEFQNRLAEAEEEAKGSHQPWMASGRISTAKDVLAGLDKIEAGANIPHTRGRMYEVRLDVGPEHLLDWDRPLSDQPAYQAVRQHWDDKVGDPDIILKRLDIGDDSTGRDLYEALGGGRRNPENASKALSEMGIRGIRYLDAGSRGKDGKIGSSNYVIFDPKHIQTVRRYAEGGGIKAYFMHAPREMGERLQRAFGGAINPIELRDDPEDMARRLILWSYAVAPVVRPLSRAEGGAIDDPVDKALSIAGAPQRQDAQKAVETARNLSDANMRKYGVKDVEEVANKLAKMLQERGANVKLNRAESFPYNDIQSTPKVSYYISNLNDPDYLIKDLGQIRISDHDGGWGSRRLAKQASIDLSKNGGILEEDLNKRFDDIIQQHYHFYDHERVAAEIKQKIEEAENARNVKRETAQNIYDDFMRQNKGNRRAHDKAIKEARKVYSSFSPSKKPNPISIRPMKRGGTVMQDEYPTHYMPNVVRPLSRKDGGEVYKAIGGGTFSGKKPPSIRNLARVKDKFIYHSGVVDDLDHMKDYLEPRHGDWIREIANHSGYDDPNELLEKSTPLVWMSDNPTWVTSKVARKLGKSHDQVTIDDIRQHGHVAVIPRKGDHAENVWKIGDEGLDNGPYSNVKNLNGKETKAYNTDLFDFDEGKEPFGVERNEYVSAQDIEPLFHLTGDDLVNFLRETNNLKQSRAKGGRVYPVAMTKESKSLKKKHAKLKKMSPQEFLNETDPLHIGKGDRKVIDTFKHNIKGGHHLGPLKIYDNGGQDGRHRANAAKELGIDKVPVIDYRKAAGGSVDDAQKAVETARNLTPMGFYSAAILKGLPAYEHGGPVVDRAFEVLSRLPR